MTDDRTLGEIEQDDIEMMEWAKKKGDRFEFYDRNQAYVFQRECLDLALELMGIPNSPQMKAKILDRLFKTRGVRIENRTFPDTEDWRSGIYVYKTKDENGDEIDELAYFISNVKQFRPSVFTVDKTNRWAVLTNVPIKDGKAKVYAFIPLTGKN